MENIIFNELKIKGYRVDVGVVKVTETNSLGKRTQKGLEIDFITTKGNNKYYIFIYCPTKITYAKRRNISKYIDFSKEMCYIYYITERLVLWR